MRLGPGRPLLVITLGPAAGAAGAVQCRGVQCWAVTSGMVGGEPSLCYALTAVLLCGSQLLENLCALQQPLLDSYG
jgi:hypothetical protein